MNLNNRLTNRATQCRGDEDCQKTAVFKPTKEKEKERATPPQCSRLCSIHSSNLPNRNAS